MRDADTPGHLLVVAHEATRTGSPVVLLDLLRRSQPLLGVPVAVRLLAEGPLAAELRAQSQVSALEGDPAAILVNSALGAGALEDYDAEVPSIVYVHEVGDALRRLEPRSARALVERADLVLAVSTTAAADLVAMGVETDRIALLPPIVSAEPADPVAVAQVRSSLGIDDDDPLVLGCGEAGWRKGADLFVDVAARLTARRRVHLAWIGRRPRSFGRLLDGDCHSVGLSDHLRWVGEVPDTRHFLAAADVVTMTSREDPQPLVPLEAALAGTPTVGFDLGGLADMAATGAAVTVGYPDTAALADAVSDLLDDPDARATTVVAAQTWIDDRHAPDAVVPAFVHAVRSVLDGATAGRAHR